MFQKLIMIGAVGKDVELKETNTGKLYCKFSLCADTKFGDKKEVLWMQCTAWGKLAEIVNQYVQKGTKLYVEGRLSATDKGNPRTYEGQSGVGTSFEMNVSELKFISGTKGSEGTGQTAPAGEDF